MAFDFSTLVTDRTKADVTAQNAKGTYMWTDLNRVTDAMDDLFSRLEKLGYRVNYHPIFPRHQDGTYSRYWEESDNGTRAQLMELYLANVAAFKSVLALPDDVPVLPSEIRYLTHHGANAIETLLQEVDSAIKGLESTFVACGPATCGGDYI